MEIVIIFSAILSIGCVIVLLRIFRSFLYPANDPSMSKLNNKLKYLGYCKECGSPLYKVMSVHKYSMMTGFPISYRYVLRCSNIHHIYYWFLGENGLDPTLTDFIYFDQVRDIVHPKIVTVDEFYRVKQESDDK